ncbi:hypothetical protein ABK040_004303 [Willaertia magna]
MKRKEITSDTTTFDISKKIKHDNPTAFSLLPQEIINHILDYCPYEYDKIHPFALISKTTRNCWLNHYLSLPYKLIIFGNGNFSFDYKISFLNDMKNISKKVPFKKEEKKKKQLNDDIENRQQIIERLEETAMIDLSENELTELRNLFNNFSSKIKIKKLVHYDGDTLCYFQYIFSFVLNNDIKFYSKKSQNLDGYGPPDDKYIPKEDSEVWEEIINNCKCNLSKEKIYEVDGDKVLTFSVHPKKNAKSKSEKFYFRTL